MKAILNQEKFNHVVLQKSLENLRNLSNKFTKSILNQEKIDHTILQKGKKILTYFCT